MVLRVIEDIPLLENAGPMVRLGTCAKVTIAAFAISVIIGEIAVAMTLVSTPLNQYSSIGAANYMLIVTATFGIACKFAAEAVSLVYYRRYMINCETNNYAIKLNYCFRATTLWRMMHLFVAMLAMIVIACSCVVNRKINDVDLISLFAAYAIVYGILAVLFLIYVAVVTAKDRIMRRRRSGYQSAVDFDEYPPGQYIGVENRQIAQVM